MMGINAAFSSWLKGAQSFATTTLRSAQNYGAALQQQTMTAVSAAQRAALQPIQQAIQPRPSTRPTSSPHAARTLTPADAVTRAVSSGVRGVQEAAGQIVRAHAPIVQGVQRDIGRATQALPQAARSAPAAFQSSVQQLSRAHAPIMQGVLRDAGSAIRSVPGALAGSGRAVSGGAQQIVQAHAPIMQGLQRDTGSAIRSISGAGALRQATPRQVPQSRIVGSHSPTPTSTSQGRVQQATGARGQAGPAPSPQQRYAQYTQDVQRYQNNPAHTRLPQLIAQHEAAVKQYGIDPQLRQYEQKLSAYNAQVNAVGPNPSRAQAETVARLQSMQRELEGMRTSIESRKRQERAEIQMLEANVRMMGAPLQAEYQRLRVEEMALRPILATRGPTRPSAVQQGVSQFVAAHAPIIQGLQRDMGRVMGAVPAPLRDAAAFANRRKHEAQAELTRAAGPAATFEQGWTYPLYTLGQGANKAYQGFVDQALPLYQRVQPLPNLPEVHSFQRGIAGSPGQLLEGLTFLPPAAERGGQLLWKEPHKLPETAAKFAGQQIEGLGAAYERDPYRLAGELVGTAALSYGLGAAAGAATRSAPKTPPGARSATPGASSGGTGRRFRALEFGYQTKQIPKPVLETKPFRLSDWQKERQRYARPRTVVPVQASSPTLPAQLQATIPVPTPRMVYISSGVAGFAARQGSRVPLAPAPQDALLDVAFAQREINPQDTLLNQGTLHPVRPALLDQDVATREKERLALVLVPLMTRPQTQDQALVTVPRPTEDRKITDPPKRRRPPVIPLYLLPPRSSTPRGKDKKKKGEDERRRRKKKGEADHWELGPAPGISEMAGMIFGTPGRSALDLLPPGTSVLNLGGSPLSYGFAPRTPAKKPAHAGEMRKKRGKATKKKK